MDLFIQISARKQAAVSFSQTHPVQFMRNKIRHLCILIRGYFIKIYAAGQTRFEDAKVPFDINGLLSELNEKQMLLKKNTHPDQILVLP